MRPTNRTTWILLLSFLGLAGLQSPGCSNEVENIARNGLDPAIKGECALAADDGDPCTLEGCEGQPNAHVVTAGLKCGLNNDLTCTPTGDCGGCATPDQCGTSTFCLPWVCNIDKICLQKGSPDGYALKTQIPGDCKEIQCDGDGGEKTVNDDTDVPKYDCYMTTCSGGMEVKTPSAQGTPCTMGGGKSCDTNGNCIECNTDNDCGLAGTFCDLKSHTCFSCTDNVKNGDESDIDCGGIRCSRCTQGQGCAIAGDCTTNFCTDGICCDNSCDKACVACNLPMSVGTCDFIAKYSDDPSFGMGMSCVAANMETCNGAGFCAGALGATCIGNTDCASGKCGMASKICVKATGDSCTQPSECFGGACTNGICG